VEVVRGPPVVVRVEMLVPRTGALALSVLVAVAEHWVPLAQAWFVGQQPPPREAGQEKKPEVHDPAVGRLPPMMMVVGEMMVVVWIVPAPVMVTVTVAAWVVVVGNMKDDVLVGDRVTVAAGRLVVTICVP
jgi:hypothetical protein